MYFFSRPLAAGCLMLVSLGGLASCESGKKPDATVQGTLTLNGELSPTGSVVFHPADKNAPVAYGTVRRDGTFALRIGQGNQRDLDNSKIYPGLYVATVAIRGPSTPDEKLGEGAPPKPGARLSAAKYSSRENSGLEYTVKAGRNVINIEVEAATEEEIAAEEEGADATDAAPQISDDQEPAEVPDSSEMEDTVEQAQENSAEESNP